MSALNYAYTMPRTPKKPEPYHAGLQNKGGAKRGTKVKHNNAINDLVMTYYGGDRAAAAVAWGCSQGSINVAISKGRLSLKLAVKISEVLKDHVTLDQMVALTKEKTH